MGFGFCDRLVFDAPGNDEEFAFVEFHDPVTQMYRQVAAEDQKELVLVFVMVPDKLTFELGELDVLAVELADDMRAPMFGELLEFLGEVHLVVLAVAHVRLPTLELTGRRPATLKFRFDVQPPLRLTVI